MNFCFHLMLGKASPKMLEVYRFLAENAERIGHLKHTPFYDGDKCTTWHISQGLGLYKVKPKEMEKIPLLSTWMKYLYCLFLDRHDPKQGMKTILTAIDYIKRGISICIFPEGTRNSGEELSLLPFKEGSFKIAEKTGCAIVPISLNNTAEMFEAHFPKIKKTHVVIEYGAPVYPKDLDKETRKHLAPYFEQIIKETIQKNVEIV